MFEVYNKMTLTKYKVYSTRDDKNGYPHFLIRNNNQWLWKSAKDFITQEEYCYRKEQENESNKEEWIKCPKVDGSISPRCIYLNSGIWCTVKKCPFSN